MKTKYSSLFSLPYLIWSLIFIIVPMGLVVVFAFTTEGGQFTLDYVSQVGEYTNVLVRSVWLAAIATIICLLIGYPLAFIMSRMPGFQQRTMLMLIMLPMWMNFLLRTYAVSYTHLQKKAGGLPSKGAEAPESPLWDGCRSAEWLSLIHI